MTHTTEHTEELTFDTSAVNKESRAILIDKFDDLKTPSGDDFEALIRSGLNQVDDPIHVAGEGSEQYLAISAPVLVANDAKPEQQLRLTPQSISLTDGESDSLRLSGERLTVFDNVLTVSQAERSFTLSGDADIEGTASAHTLIGRESISSAEITTAELNVKQADVAILSAQVNAEGTPSVNAHGKVVVDDALTVKGTTHTQSLQVSQAATLATLIVEQSSELRGLTSAAQAIFTDHVEARDSLGIGINKASQESASSNGRVKRAKLHINKTHSDTDALLRIDDENSDSTPLFIDSEGRMGIGTEQPQAQLDVHGEVRFKRRNGEENAVFSETGPHRLNGNVGVSGSLAVGSNELPVEDGCLHVAGKLAVGKRNPMAELDILAADAGKVVCVTAPSGKLLDVEAADEAGDNKFTVHPNTEIKRDLTVAGQAKAKSVTATEQVTAASATVTGGITANSATLATLDVTGNAEVKARVKAQTLFVGPALSGALEQSEVNDGVYLNTGMTVKGTTHAKDIVATGDISTDTQLSSATANVTQKLCLGSGTSDVNSKLLVKTANKDEMAMLVRDEVGNALLQLDKTHLQIGSEGQAHTVDIKGQVTARNATVTDTTSMHTAKVSNVLHVGENDAITKWATTAKLAVLADDNTAPGFALGYKDGSQIKPLMTSLDSRIGFFQASPKAPLHISGATLFDSSVKMLDNFSVAKAGEIDTTFAVAGEQVAIGNTGTEVTLDVYGAATHHGQFAVTVDDKPLLSTSANQVTVTQLDDMGALKVTDEMGHSSTYIQSGKVAINQELAKTNVNFAVTGEAEVSGLLTLKNDDTALCVMGDSVLQQDLTVHGNTKVQDGLTVSVTNNTGTAAKNAFNVHGATHLSGTLTTEQHATLNQGLTVSGNNGLGKSLTVLGHLSAESSMIVTGRTRLEDWVKIAKPKTGPSITVDGQVEFYDDFSLSGGLVMTPERPMARVHIQEKDTAVLRLDKADGAVGLVFHDGQLGLGVANPDYMLDVAEDSQFRKDLQVLGRLDVEESLQVNEYASFRSNLNVAGFTELSGETRIGITTRHSDDKDPHPALGQAQFSLEQNHFDTALAVYHRGAAPVVIKSGCVGIQTDKPTQALDVNGNVVVSGNIQLEGVLTGSGRLECMDGAKIFGDVELRSDLTVSDDVWFKDTLKVEGKAEFLRNVDITGDVTIDGAAVMDKTLDVTGRTHLKDELCVDKHTKLHGGLLVDGFVADSQVIIKPYTELKSGLDVIGEATFQNTVSARSLSSESSVVVTGKEQHAAVALNALDPDKFVAVTVAGNNVLNVASGKTVIGSENAPSGLDVFGELLVSKTLTAKAKLSALNDLSVEGMTTLKGSLSAKSLQLADGGIICEVSNDAELGGDTPSSQKLVTQAAIKSYIDNHGSYFTQGNKVVLVHNQQEFDELMSKEVLSNITILLLPHSSHPQMNRAYKLKQAVRIASNVSIVGFNAAETRIVKSHPGCRFLIQGESDALVKNVVMSGFTFDGNLPNGNVYEGNGGAFSLRYVDNLTLNCVIENHHVNGDGGAIYGDAEVGGVEALFIRKCSATRQGGAAYGLKDSTIHAEKCSAEFGGAVAHCDNCEVQAQHNSATVHGGGAYKCMNLLAKGFWRQNRAKNGLGNHIFSDGCDPEHDQTEDMYWWHGIFFDKPVVCNSHVWRNDHI